MQLQRSHKILIIRFSSIGDIVLTTPIIRCIKQQTGATIHFLTKKSYRAVVANNPYIDQVHIIKKKNTEIISTLKAERYDYIIDLHHNLRSLQITWALGVKRFTFNKLNIEKWLMVRWKINRLPAIHIVARYFETISAFDIKNDGKGLDYFIPPNDEVNILDWIPQSKSVHYIAFVIGAAHATKRMPTEKIISVCKNINAPIVLLGGPDEQATGDEIAHNTGGHVINTCGKLNLNQSASMVRQATQVITHDTGLMHIASAFQKDIISIWGNTIPEFGMYPYYGETNMNKNISLEVKQLSCRPCSKIGYEQCPLGHFRCMNEIALELFDTNIKL